jgi:hypothetical protein
MRICLAAFMGLLFASAAMAAPGALYTVVAEGPLYASADPSAEVVARLKPGDRVIEFSRSGSRIKIGVLGAVDKNGWVEAAQLAAAERVVAAPPTPPAREEAKAPLPAASKKFLLEVPGSPQLEYRGSCVVTMPSGATTQRALADFAPHAYEFEGAAISCTVTALDGFGRLVVRLSSGGVVIAAGDIRGPSNFVRVWSATETARAGCTRNTVRGRMVVTTTAC